MGRSTGPLLLPKPSSSRPASEWNSRFPVHALLVVVRLRGWQHLFRSWKCDDHPQFVAVETLRASAPSARPVRAAEDCGGIGAGAASDRATGAADCADRRTKKGAPAQALH